MPRFDGRRPDQLRPLEIIPNYQKHAEGSALVKLGDTWVLCAASVEAGVPPFLVGKNQGWLTAEYAMLPRSTQTRTSREIGRGGPSGRTHEIQRLIGRSLRAVADMRALGERTLTIDCDVLQADGGTRTAAITGAYVAFALASNHLQKIGKITRPITNNQVAAVSVGIVGKTPLLDLKYDEDSKAEVDMNVVCTSDGRFIELQGTAEREPFSRQQMDELIALATRGIETLIGLQQSVLATVANG